MCAHTESLGFSSVFFVYMTVNYNIIMSLFTLTIEYILVADLSVFFFPPLILSPELQVLPVD